MAENELYDVRNNFYLGNYQQAIAEGYRIEPSTAFLRVERDSFVFRSHIAQRNFQVALDGIRESSDPSLKAVKLLALYQSSPERRESTLASVREMLLDPSHKSNSTLQVIAASIFLQENSLDECLRAVSGSQALEAVAMRANLFLKLNRVDLAQRELRAMNALDDDAPLTNLVNAWICIAQGRGNDGAAVLNDLSERFGSSAVLLNGLAICKMQAGQFEDAEKLLTDALGHAAADADTLSNLIVCLIQLRRPAETITRYQSYELFCATFDSVSRQLKSTSGWHVACKSSASIENSFDMAARAYTR